VAVGGGGGGFCPVLGSYPSRRARRTILHELAKNKRVGVRTFQDEDESPAQGPRCGAASAGRSQSRQLQGPAWPLKSEALGLGVALELPLIICDIRGPGRSTGMRRRPSSKTAAGDFGCNGEEP